MVQLIFKEESIKKNQLNNKLLPLTLNGSCWMLCVHHENHGLFISYAYLWESWLHPYIYIYFLPLTHSETVIGLLPVFYLSKGIFWLFAKEAVLVVFSFSLSKIFCLHSVRSPNLGAKLFFDFLVHECFYTWTIPL